ncbi:hypothetical protein DZC52_05105 [Wenzhouxiangella sediminis]|uniref:Uncharacterized protein n=1 Tax=Wenzhouxiangella sediminis TaxID=1792836 RepID=A0A3E1KA77_9GAMM|nr:hypothetical protein DZC52_05105 [Wenzhouxiangella sediminis]
MAALLSGAAQLAQAELIDDFGVSQGPFTVGPGEEVSEDEGILETPSVLGGFRILVPALDDEAPPGSTVTASVAGGQFTCQVNLSSAVSDTGGGCGTGYDRSDGPLFDLTGSSAFEIDIESVSGGAVMQVSVTGPDQNNAIAFVQSPSPGQLVIPFDQFISMTPTPLEWDRVDNILITTGSIEGASGHVTLDRFGTDGPIANGEAEPGDESDDDVPTDAQLREEAYGNFYNPGRSGEGIQLTLENDGETFVLTYYTYLDGEQVWLIGIGTLSNGRILFDEMSITQGADYGSAFDPDDVDYTHWGSIEMEFIDCDRAVLDIDPVLDGFEPFAVEMQRIVPTQCDAGGPSMNNRVITGNWYDPARSGEGFQLAWEEGQFVLTYYTYNNGKQTWLLGLGERFGDTLIFPDVNITGGADFGGRFRPGDVQSEFFGAIEMTIEDCNNATIQVESALAGFEDQTLDVEKIVPGSCN